MSNLVHPPYVAHRKQSINCWWILLNKQRLGLEDMLQPWFWEKKLERTLRGSCNPALCSVLGHHQLRVLPVIPWSTSTHPRCTDIKTRGTQNHTTFSILKNDQCHNVNLATHCYALGITICVSSCALLPSYAHSKIWNRESITQQRGVLSGVCCILGQDGAKRSLTTLHCMQASQNRLKSGAGFIKPTDGFPE